MFDDGGDSGIRTPDLRIKRAKKIIFYKKINNLKMVFNKVCS